MQLGEGSSSSQYKNSSEKFTKGIIHGYQATAFFGDKNLYYALISIWKKSGDFEFEVDEFKGSFYSKKSGLKKDGKGLFEYVFKLESGFRKLFLTFSPRLQGMEYRNGKKWRVSRKQGEGVAVGIKSTYIYPSEIEELILMLFERFDLKRFYNSWNKEESYIISMENYIRYHEGKENDVARVLEDIWLLVGLSDEYKGEHKVDKVKEGYKFARVITDKWDKLGFDTSLFFYIKSYRLKEFPEVESSNETLRHPKLEIGVDPAYNKGNRPKWDEWKEIYLLQNEIRNNIAIWSGMSLEDVVEDEMFKVRENRTALREWRPEELKEYYMERAREIHPEVLDNPTKRKFIYLLCDRGVLDTKELMEELGLKRMQVFRLIKYFEEKGIVRRISSSRTAIEFVNPLLEKHFKEKTELMNNLASFDKRGKGANKTNKRHIPISAEIFEQLKELKEESRMNWDEFFEWVVKYTKDLRVFSCGTKQRK